MYACGGAITSFGPGQAKVFQSAKQKVRETLAAPRVCSVAFERRGTEPRKGQRQALSVAESQTTQDCWAFALERPTERMELNGNEPQVLKASRDKLPIRLVWAVR